MEQRTFLAGRITAIRCAILCLLCLSGAALAETGLAPDAATQRPMPIRSHSATLTGMVVPNGAPTTAWFEWGTDSNFGKVSGAIDAGAGTNVVWLTNHITGLTLGQAYHYRIAASNQWGVTYGKEEVFGVGQRVEVLDYAWGAHPLIGFSNIVSVVAGSSSNLALTADGTVISWDRSGANVAVVPGLTNAIAIFSNYDNDNSFALKSDGSIFAWGWNQFGECNLPAGLTNVISVSGYLGQCIALKKNGTVVGWPRPVPPSNNVVVISGEYLLRSDGRVNNGQFYQLSNVVGLSFYRSSTWPYALLRDGTVVGFFGKPLPGVSNIVGMSGELALRSDGVVIGAEFPISTEVSNAVAISWASFSQRALVATPQPLTGCANADLVLRLEGYFESSPVRICRLPGKGLLYQCDAGVRGALIGENDVVTDPQGRVVFVPETDTWGTPYTTFEILPAEGSDEAPASVAVNILAQAPYVFTSSANRIVGACATLNGTVTPNYLPTTAWFEWGTTSDFGHQTPSLTLPGKGDVRWITNRLCDLDPSMKVIHYRLVASNALGVVYGAERLFTLGSKLWGRAIWSDFAFPVGVSNLVSVAACVNQTYALKNDGGIWVGGFSSNPPPAAMEGVVEVSVNHGHKLALKEDGTVVGWDFEGQPEAAPDGVNHVRSIAATVSGSLALKEDGMVTGWGAISNVPVNLKHVVEIAAGNSVGLMLLDNGTVVTCGERISSPLYNVPPGLTNVVQIAVGTADCLALKSDGTVVSWPEYEGDLDKVPPGLSNVIAIADGGDTKLALRRDGSLVSWGWPGSGFNVNLTNCAAIYVSEGLCLALADNSAPECWPYGVSVPPEETITISLDAMDPNQDPFSVRVLTLPGYGALYQRNADGGLGLEITEPNTLVTNSSVIFVPKPGLSGVLTTSFDWVANDGEFDSVPATQTIRIAARQTIGKLSATAIGETAVTLDAIVNTAGRDASVTFSWYSDGGNGVQSATLVIPASSMPAPCSVTATDIVPFGAFHYLMEVNDDYYGEFSGWQTLAMGRLLIGPCSISDSGARVSFSGPSNYVFSVWASMNLIDWSPVGTTVETKPGNHVFDDADCAGISSRFYQLRYP